MRLKCQHDSLAGKCAARSLQYRIHLDRMVAVVIDQRKRAAGRNGNFTVTLESPPDTRKARKCCGNVCVVDASLARDGNRRERIQHIVIAGEIEFDVENLFVATAHGGEFHHAVRGANIYRAQVHILTHAVGQHRLGEARQDFADVGIVGTQHRQTIKRQVLQEFHECRLKLAEVVRVGIHMVLIDIGDHRHDRLQVQKRCIGLICLGHQILALAEPGVGADGIQASANHAGRIQPRFAKHMGNQGGRRGLAVGACNGNTQFEAHQFGEHHGARNNRHACVLGCHHFRIVGLHCARGDYHVGAGNVAGNVPGHHLRAECPQALDDMGLGKVRAADGVAEIDQHLSNAGHA